MTEEISIEEIVKNKLSTAISFYLPSNALEYEEYADTTNNIRTQIIVKSPYDKEGVINECKDRIIQYIKEKKSQNNELDINSIIEDIVSHISNNYDSDITLDGSKIYSVPYSIKTKTMNGKPILIEFGVDDDGHIYTKEEIKVLIKQAEYNYSTKQTNTTTDSGRADDYTFLSLLVDISETLTQENPIRLVNTNINSKQDKKDLKENKIKQTDFNRRRQVKLDRAFKNIQQAVNKAKQDPISPNILLVPYSADGHIVTLLVDKREFPKRNSVACFDSSHYFNKFGSLNPKHFSKDLLYTLDTHQKPINKNIIQKWSGTCSFYTEAFCYIVSNYIQENHDVSLDDIINLVNSPLFEKSIKLYKKQFLDEYEATMKEVKQKQEQQKQNIKKMIIGCREQNPPQNRQLTPDELHYQQLLNQYSNYRFGQEFTSEINTINSPNLFNSDQQNALVPHFIDSTTLTHLNGGSNIIVGFHNNVRNIVYHANDENSVLNNGTIPVNFIYTLGTKNNQNPDAGAHYVAAQIFRYPTTNELVVLHYDSLNGKIDNEFKDYIKQQFGENIRILNISNKNRFTQQNQGGNTCGLCALTALRHNGILDQEREHTIKYGLSQDADFNVYNTQEAEHERIRQTFGNGVLEGAIINNQDELGNDPQQHHMPRNTRNIGRSKECQF